ncbi:MAG: hypothetical protein IPM36_20230 [Lewinellaceae bacterium]|nr:hypothetical protein [Lewinellaceae bacterium]
MIRIFFTCLLAWCCATASHAQYLENFSGQNGKGLIDAVCPNGSTLVTQCGSNCTANNLANCSAVPSDLSGVNWTLVVPGPGSFFTDNSGTGFTNDDYYGVVSNQMEVTDSDNEICWLSPTLNIGSAGPVTISVDVDEDGNLDNDDFIRAEYSLNGGGWVQFGYENNDFSAQTFTSSSISGSTLVIRICASTDSGSESIYFDNVRVPQAGVTVGCTPPTFTKAVTPASACQPNSGAIQITASGGTPGYNVAWGGAGSGNPAGTEIASSGGSYTITGLTAGNYTVTVTDANSCSATMTATVGTIPALSLSTQVANAACPTDANGAINLTVTNGASPYSYAWSNLPGAPDPEDQTGLLPGTYTVTVTDNNSCTATTSATVGVVPAGPYLETFSTPNKGYLTSMANDFTGVNWTMSPWSMGDRDANDYFRTNGGVLEGVDFDAEVCWLSPLFNISASGVVSIAVDATWENFNSGTPGDYIHLQYSVNGGAFATEPNQFGGGTNGTVHYASGSNNDGSGTLTAGGISGNTLQIRICGNFNFNDEEITLDNVRIPQTVSLACATPALSINTTNVLCNGASTGALNLSVTDGTPPYSYSWSNLPGSPDPEDQMGLPAGTYTVTVTDDNGVTATASATISQPSAINLSTSVMDVACFGYFNGAIDLTVGGGTPGYTYAWSNGPVSQDINFLSADTYTVTVTDQNGCTKTTSATVGEPDPLFALGIADNVACKGGSTGAISLTVIGGTPGYTYAWTSGPTTQDLNNISAGTYTVTVTDARGCTTTSSATVSEPSSIVTGSTMVTSACNVNDGAINVTASGGVPGYQVKWSGPSGGDPAGVEIAASGGMYNITGLTVGAYTITITDANSCTTTTTATVSTAGCCMVSANAGPGKFVCPNGSIGIGGAPTGSGTPTLSYAWAPAGTLNDPTAANPIASPANTTTYTVTVTSSAGCSSTASVTVTVYTPPVASGTPTNPLCNGQNGKITMTISSGATPYDISWDGPGANDGLANNQASGYMIQNLPAGTYAITVSDNNSCTATTSATITEPPALTVLATPTDESCPGDANGKITVTIGGGTPLYSIYWVDTPNGSNPNTVNNQSSGYMIQNLPAGNYFVSVTDANFCSKTTTTAIGTANPTPECSISDAMGAVCPNSSGNQYQAPAGMDSYSWSVTGNGMHSGPLDQQTLLVDAGASGTYTVTVVVTKNGCTASCSKTVMIDMIPFEIVYNPQYCQDDPGPVIGLNGSETGAIYKLQSTGGGGIFLDSSLVGTGSSLVFGAFPNGSYQVTITGGTCDGTISGTIDGTAADCPIALPGHCACDDPSGFTPVTVKVTAPPFQNWTVTEVIGLYGPSNPYPPIAVGTPLNYIGGNMYTLDAARDNTKGYFVRVSNGFTEKVIQVGYPSW